MITHLINLVIVQVGTVGNIFSAHGVIHVGLDATRCDYVAGNLLVTHV